MCTGRSFFLPSRIISFTTPKHGRDDIAAARNVECEEKSPNECPRIGGKWICSAILFLEKSEVDRSDQSSISCWNFPYFNFLLKNYIKIKFMLISATCSEKILPFFLLESHELFSLWEMSILQVWQTIVDRVYPISVNLAKHEKQIYFALSRRAEFLL